MGKWKAFLLCTFFLMDQMGRSQPKSMKSMLHHARTKTGGHVDLCNEKLPSTEREYMQIEVNNNPGETRKPRTLEEIDFYTGIKRRRGTASEIPPHSEADESSGYQSEMDKAGTQNQTESYTTTGGKTGNNTTSPKMAKEGSTEIEGKYPSRNESDRNNLQDIKHEDDAAKDAISTGNENQMKVSERTSTDPENTEQEGHLGPSVVGRIIEENETAKNCQNIGIPLVIAILLIMEVAIVCLGTICCLQKKHQRHSYERAAEEIATSSREEVIRHGVRSKGRPQKVCSEETRSPVAFKSTDGFRGIPDGLAQDHDPGRKAQTASVNESDKGALQNIEFVEDIADKQTKGRTEEKQGASSESDAEASEKTDKDGLACLQGETPITSEDGGTMKNVILQHKYNLRSYSMRLNLPTLRLLSDIYTDPKITVTQYELGGVTGENERQVREVEIHEILNRSKSDADETSVHVVYGAAGTGKNTIVQKIIYDWAMGMRYEEFSFVFHFKIHNLNAIKGRIALRALILEAHPYLSNYLDHLWKEPQNLLFIFDDLDRSYRSFVFSDNGRHLTPQFKCSGPESVCFVSDILRCLLDGDFLRGCTVLITTRHWNQETLRHLVIDSKFHVMGFSSQKAKEYFCRHLSHGKYTNEVIKLISQNDILQSMCSNSLFCVTLASSLEFNQPQREEQTTMPVIIHTQVLFDYVTLLLQECGYDRKTTDKCLREVGELAYEGIKRNTLSFGADALSGLNTCPDSFPTVFMFQDPDKQSSGVAYEFRHDVIRDFLAALTHILHAPSDRLKGVLDETFMDTGGRFRTFLLFLVGLSSQKSTNRLKSELDSDRSEVTLCVSDWLTNSVKRRLTNMDGKYTQRKFLDVLYCLLEFGDNRVMSDVLSANRTIKLNQLHLTSPDCIVLSRTLIYSELIEELDVSSCLAESEDIQGLEPVLHRCLTLRLNQNNLQDSGVTHVANILKRSECKIQILELKFNHLTDDCLDTLFSALRTNSSLTELNLSNSSQEGKHANEFTHEKMQHLIDSCSQQREIRWLSYELTGQKSACSATVSNILTVITE